MGKSPNWSGIEANFQKSVDDTVKSITNEAQSRAVRASNEMRNAALKVFSGMRSGRRYKKRYSKNAYYTASAPGEAPASPTGTLRRSWSIRATGNRKGNINAGINTDVKHAPYLDGGTGKMDARPFKEPVIERSRQKVIAIFSEPFKRK